MGPTRTFTSVGIKVDKDLDLNGNKAKNAKDAELSKELVTKEQLEETAETIEQKLEWQGLQW